MFIPVFFLAFFAFTVVCLLVEIEVSKIRAVLDRMSRKEQSK